MNLPQQTSEQLEILYEVPLLRGRFATFNTRPDFELISTKQTHSNIIIHESLFTPGVEADGIIGDSSTPLAILTADCLPIVILGKSTHAFIHAGWRGLAGGILTQKEILAMSPLYAFIGPHIRQKNYEVQKEFTNNFPKHPEAFKFADKKIFFDLADVASTELKKLSPGIEIVDCGICTFADHHFSSYRRNNTTQRNWNIYIP